MVKIISTEHLRDNFPDTEGFANDESILSDETSLDEQFEEFLENRETIKKNRYKKNNFNNLPPSKKRAP